MSTNAIHFSRATSLFFFNFVKIGVSFTFNSAIIVINVSLSTYRVLLLGILFFQTLFIMGANQERFLHFTEIDGLPRNITTCLAQDQYAYVWIGTNNGITRFDGKNFKIYPELKNCGIISLLYDTNHQLWAGTHLGLYKYNPLTDYFDLLVNGYVSKISEDNGHIYFLMVSNIYKVLGSEIQLIISVDNISDFCFSEAGLWVSKKNDGLVLYDREANFKSIKATHLSHMHVAKLGMVDGTLFVGMFDGALYTISANEDVQKIALDNHYFYKAYEKVGSEVWVATDGNGIFILDEHLSFLKKLDRSRETRESINSNSIYDILTGENGEIWLASYGAGLTCILPDNQLFQNILPEKGNPNSLVANEGVSVFVKEPFIYFGTNYGLSKWDIEKNKYTHLQENRLHDELNGVKITAVYTDHDQTVWIGTYDGLLGHYTPDLQLIKTYHPSSELPGEMQQIVDIKGAGNDNLIILTHFHSNILLNFDKKSGKSEVFELYFKGSKTTYCLLNTLRLNQHGELLAVITNLGLFHVNWKDNVLENRLNEMNLRLNFSIVDFYHDKQLNYWVSASTEGLIMVSPDGKVFKKWTGKDGLSSSALVRMESTDDHYLWISTISGICRFDMKTFATLNFNHRDGLPANEFNERVSATISDGRIVFGSLAGFTIIDPSKVDSTSRKPEVVISDITFQNQSIRSTLGGKMLQQPLEEISEISLPFDKNSFSIHFFTKNKSFSHYHHYEYRLIGLEENWNYQGETSFTTYTNLSPGEYVFEIRAADINHLTKTTRLTIDVKPPWYFKWYAYLAYIILFFIILYLSIYAFLKRFELLKEKEIASIELQKEHELTEKKLEFFTNVSHDLKTPLTLIDAPVSDLLESDNLQPLQIEKLHLIKRNAQRLYQLISDLLDFRLITKKQLALEVEEINITQLIENIIETFRNECNNQSIDLVFHHESSLTGFIDAKKMEKVLWNLLSNALKFSHKEGTILVEQKAIENAGERFLQFKVTDAGIGIPESELPRIFDRFYKVKDSIKMNNEGTGIGLSIVKELVEIHHGVITVESLSGAGTTFAIIIPIDQEAYSESEILTNESIERMEHIGIIEHPDFTPLQKRYNRQALLIVEDNIELRNFLAGHFEQHYRVFTASDGAEGLALAREMIPDLILTDVQMPGMNGFAFCKEIRASFDTSHIPILMLTASSSIEQQLEGLATGADIYLTKPFDIRLLDAQISSMLENRRNLRARFHGIDTSENLEKTLPPRDLAFIMDLKTYIEENMMKNDLNIEMLSDRFSVSVAQLHRKIKSLTGLTPNNLIKSIRLQIAYQLIKEQGLRISEAAYQTGFSDPNYFTTCFKKEFGINPSQV